MSREPDGGHRPDGDECVQHEGARPWSAVEDRRERQEEREVAQHVSRQSDERAIVQFVQEAQILAKLHHPNIVGVQGLGRFPAGGYFIVMDFPSYAADSKYNRGTLLTRLGWERVVPLHHLFVLLAYLFFAASPLFGLSLSLLWPAFLTLPFALFQIFQLRSIALGGAANWTLLSATALSVFGLTAYFLSLTFWLR